ARFVVLYGGPAPECDAGPVGAPSTGIRSRAERGNSRRSVARCRRELPRSAREVAGRDRGFGGSGGHASDASARNRRRRRLLPTTNTEENAIAAPAIIGLSSPAAASGIAATLYPNAQNRLPLIVPSVRRESRIASAALRRSPRTRVMSAASMATSVPVPMARPRSA